jgi:Chromo (CHRromatin Organisation MOdifier) domain
VDKIIGKRLGKDAQMEYLVLWKGYPESEATWETYEVVKELAALDEFEQVTASAVHSRVQAKVNSVWRKWTKNNVQQYILTLHPPPEACITTTELSKILKKHHVNGEKLTELTRELLVEMGLSLPAAEWFEKQLDEMLSK